MTTSIGRGFLAVNELNDTARFARRLWMATLLCTTLLLLCILAGGLSAWLLPQNLAQQLWVNQAAVLCVLGTTLHASYRLAHARAPDVVLIPAWIETLRQLVLRQWPRTITPPAWQRILSRFGTRAEQVLGAEVLYLAAWLLILLGLLYWGWQVPVQAAALSNLDVFVGAGMLLLAFLLLVFEREVAAHPAEEWPEAPALQALLHVALLLTVLGACSWLGASPSRQWPQGLANGVSVLLTLLTLEFLVRLQWACFRSRQRDTEPPLLANSQLARLLCFHSRPLQSLHAALYAHFGLDLRQLWAFAFIRRALLPLLAVLLGLAWLLSGVYEIPLAERGVYERLGKPVAVLEPGLHVGLPWPLGQVRRVEYGVVHELATRVTRESTTNSEPTATVEGPAPASANRLWDSVHTKDNSQVIASVSEGRQSFQILNMDIRFVYRIGLSDQAALDATYRNDDIPSLIRSAAGWVLVHQFSSTQLDTLLRGQNPSLAQSIAAAVQGELNRVHSGVEILAAVIEAIHPPAGAANAYHAVQAAQIAAQAMIARERGLAAAQLNEARLAASVARDNASANAREIAAAAQVSTQQFNAEQQAYRSGGEAFLLEHRLQQLSQGLARAKVVIIDHRIAGNTLDLRTWSAPAAADIPAK